MKRKVLLSGGPFDGAQVETTEQWPHFSCEGEGVPDGFVASYTATLDPGVCKFRGLTKVVARLPMPGACLDGSRA